MAPKLHTTIAVMTVLGRSLGLVGKVATCPPITSTVVAKMVTCDGWVLVSTLHIVATTGGVEEMAVLDGWLDRWLDR